MLNFTGGWGGIRTPGSIAASTVFKTAAIDRSATHPKLFCRSCKPTVFALHVFHIRAALRSQDAASHTTLPPIRILLCAKQCAYFILFFTKRNRKNNRAAQKHDARQQLPHGQPPAG